MQRSLSTSLDLRNTNKPLLIGEDEDEDVSDDDRSDANKGGRSDTDDEEAEAEMKRHKLDPNYSPRKVCQEEVASFERTASSISIGSAGQNGNHLGSRQSTSLSILVPKEEAMSDAEAYPAHQGGIVLDTLVLPPSALRERMAQADQAFEAESHQLQKAVLEGKVAELKRLVGNVHDNARRVELINHGSGKDGFSPLMIAVSCEEEKADVELVKYLLQMGARTDVIDRKGNTALHWAAAHGQTKVLKLLLEDQSAEKASASPQQAVETALKRRNNVGDTALHMASRHGRIACCEYLLSKVCRRSIVHKPRAPLRDLSPEKMSEDDERKDKGKEESEKASEAKSKTEPEKKTSRLGALHKERNLAKTKVLALLKESEVNNELPHFLLLLRNDQYDTAFDVAGNDASIADDSSVGTPAMVKQIKAQRIMEVRQQVHGLFYDASAYFRTLILHHEDCFGHLPVEGEDVRDIWEAPERLPAILSHVASELEQESVIISSKFQPASEDTLRLAHSDQYVKFVSKLSSRIPGPVPFTPLVQRDVLSFEEKDLKKPEHCDTSFSPGSLAAATRAAGAVCFAIDRVVGGLQRNAFCVVRPPGHHAGINGLLTSASSCGFCIFNNVAVGALHALAQYPDKVRKVAIIDFDVHHGNGTEEIVAAYNREAMVKMARSGSSTTPFPPIMFFSSHVFDVTRPANGVPEYFYPGSGQFSDLTGNIINAPMQPLWRRRGYRKQVDGRRSWAERFYFDHFGRAEFRRIVKEKLLPALRTFGADLILLSAGFDASRRDVGNGRFVGKYCSGFDLEQHDFTWIAGQIASVANVTSHGRVVSVLEGGYGRFKNPLGNSANDLSIDRSSLARNCVSHILGLIDPQSRPLDSEDGSEVESDYEEAQEKDVEEKLSTRRMRTRRPPARFEGASGAEQQEPNGTTRRRRRGEDSDSENDSDENGGRVAVNGTKKPASTTNKQGKAPLPQDAKRRRKDRDGDNEDTAQADGEAQSIKRDQALFYLSRVKTKYADEPDVYKHFLIVMGQFKQGSIGVNQVISEVKRLFQGDRALIEGFNAFLPPGFVVTYTAEDERRYQEFLKTKASKLAKQEPPSTLAVADQ